MKHRTVTLSMCLSSLLGAGLSSLVLPRTAKANSQPEISAQKFVLVDSTGAKRAELGILGENRNFQGCYSGASDSTAESTLSGPGLAFYDANHKPTLVLHHATRGSEISVCNSTGKLRVQLGVFDNDPHLYVFSHDGSPSIGLDANSDSVSISMYDPRIKSLVPRVLLATGKKLTNSVGDVSILDNKGTVIWSAP